MGVSYTSASERDRRRQQGPAANRHRDALVYVTAAVALLAIVVAYIGRLHAFDVVEAGQGRVVVNLSTVTSVAEVEPALALAFDHPADRRLVARELLSALRTNPSMGDLVNVGAIARLEVPVAALEGLPPGARLAARQAAAREAQRDDDSAAAPVMVPLFTASELAAVKPALSVRTRDEHRSAVLWSALALVAAFVVIPLVWRYRRVTGDRVLLTAAFLLVTLGFVVMLGRPDPVRDTVLVVRYAQGVVIGAMVFLAVSMVNVRWLSHLGLSYLPLALALLLSIVLILFGSGPGTSNARINLGPVQPMEAIRLLLALFLAGYFARRWEVVRQVRGTVFRNHTLPAWVNVPRPDLVLPVLAAVGLALILFFALKDLGPALLVSLAFLMMFAVARAQVGLAVFGLLVLGTGFALGHTLGISSTLSARVAMWQSPWENAVRGGDQVAQAAWALATGAVWGTGLGLGSSRYLPAGHTDLALAAIGEELGVMGILAVAAAFVVMAWRGLHIARRASTDYGVFLALGMTLLLVVPAIVMTAGLLGVIPLTGVVTPFVSYGGSAMLANFVALGLLVACVAPGAAAGATAPFHVPLRWLGRTLAVAGLVLMVVWVRVQVVSADAVLVKPQLGRQADGGLRYQYNPRVLEMARLIPRGTIFDRAGIPIASNDPALVAAEAEVYRRLSIDPAVVCPQPGERCYPLGAKAFHLVGDARTLANWGASNSSYVERDAEDRLRGFDDRAVAVRTAPAEEGGGLALRRDYTPIVPLVRHRWDPAHPDVRAVFERPRDVTLTIDARLQHHVATILQRAVASAGVQKGAAVVLDAATGEVLATASYPWPTGRSAAVLADAALDRARYGLYPPGSTFKVVTAAAALRQDPSLSGLSFVCSRLPDNRVGARIPGQGRPVRDDIRDRNAHGAIDMHDGLVRSCNAYFAQLAVRLGPEVMADTSSLAGITLSSSSDPGRIREQLPHAGYGQGQVVTTPLRMARVVAAIASDGAIREVPIVQGAAGAVSTAWLQADGAALLRDFMRDAVTDGTGRLLARHPMRIAGKTGTAEVDGAASHAWFVGFAPHGAATKRITFAVVLEHAGYGGASAAAASGQIVTAAAALGLVQ